MQIDRAARIPRHILRGSRFDHWSNSFALLIFVLATQNDPLPWGQPAFDFGQLRSAQTDLDRPQVHSILVIQGVDDVFVIPQQQTLFSERPYYVSVFNLQ